MNPRQTCPLMQPWLKCRTESQETGLAQPSHSISTPTYNTCDVYSLPWHCLYPSQPGMQDLYEAVCVIGLWEPSGMIRSKFRADGRTHLHLRWVLRRRHCVYSGLPLAVGGSGCARKHPHGSTACWVLFLAKRPYPLEDKSGAWETLVQVQLCALSKPSGLWASGVQSIIEQELRTAVSLGPAGLYCFQDRCVSAIRTAPRWAPKYTITSMWPHAPPCTCPPVCEIPLPMAWSFTPGCCPEVTSGGKQTGLYVSLCVPW